MSFDKLSDFSTNDLLEVLDNISEAVVVRDHLGYVVWVNKTLCELLGITEQEWIGKTTRQLINEGYLDKNFSLPNVKSGKESTGFVRTRNGTEFMSRVRAIYDANLNVKYYITTSMTLQELSLVKDKLEKLRRQNNHYYREIEYLRELLLLDKDFVLESSEMKSLISDVRKVAPVNTTVLITGESGVGKEKLAQTIHMNSRRKNGPFIPVTIPSIPSNLLESEIFGYEEGAFTGAVKGGKPGLFEIAQGGTLFLDEVGDCPYEVQVKLLRAIETGEIRRVGGTKDLKLDVRIIAATNKDLGTMIKKGLFREDLFYRLSVVPLHIKPLRERQDDIEPFCDYFIEKVNSKYSMNKKFSKQAIERLKTHSWPGNVRELRNVVERLVILSEANEITALDVDLVLEKSLVKSSKEDADTAKSTWGTYESYERSRILEVLKQVGGNKSKAAAILGISRTKLYKKLNNL